MRGLEQFLSKRTAHLHHTTDIVKGLCVQATHQSWRHAHEIHLERAFFVVNLLVVHVFGEVKELSARELGQDAGAREQLDHLLLQSRELIVLGEGEKLADVLGASDSIGLGLAEGELIFVEIFDHLFEGDGIVSHETDEVTLGGTFGRFGFLYFFIKLG